MAKEYRAPIDPPAFNVRSYVDDSKAYIESLRKMATKANPRDALAGKVVRWQRADGYAQYMVWSSSPLSLIHIDTGDGYMVEAALIRGLRLADVKAMVKADEALARLFSKGA